MWFSSRLGSDDLKRKIRTAGGCEPRLYMSLGCEQAKKRGHGSRAAVVLRGARFGRFVVRREGKAAKEDVTEVRSLEENTLTGVMVQLSG